MFVSREWRRQWVLGQLSYWRESDVAGVMYNSNVALKFAEALEKSSDIKLYAKLPNWFKIDTPLGMYNQDWAVLVEMDGKTNCTLLLRPKAIYRTANFARMKGPKWTAEKTLRGSGQRR